MDKAALEIGLETDNSKGLSTAEAGRHLKEFGEIKLHSLRGAVAFLVVALSVPVLDQYLKLSSIGIVPVLCLALTALVATAWMEVRKHFCRN